MCGYGDYQTPIIHSDMRFSSHIRSRLTDFGLHRGGCIHFGGIFSLRPCDLYTVMPLIHYTIELEGVVARNVCGCTFVILPTLDKEEGNRDEFSPDSSDVNIFRCCARRCICWAGFGMTNGFPVLAGLQSVWLRLCAPQVQLQCHTVTLFFVAVSSYQHDM